MCFNFCFIRSLFVDGRFFFLYPSGKLKHFLFLFCGNVGYMMKGKNSAEVKDELCDVCWVMAARRKSAQLFDL